MKLPNLEKALVEERKITAYLLSDENSGGKSMFFTAFGFTVDAWKMLRDSLLEHVAAYEITRTLKSPYGFKYIIEGAMPTPDGRSPNGR